MTKQCCVCGKEFEADKRNRVTCGSDECKRLHHLEYMRTYGHQMRRQSPEEIREYKRNWIRKRRAERRGLKVEEEKPTEIKEPIPAENYAEIQKQRTLAMVGRIEL